jgi:hypothetical protein
MSGSSESLELSERWLRDGRAAVGLMATLRADLESPSAD